MVGFVLLYLNLELSYEQFMVLFQSASGHISVVVTKFFYLLLVVI